MPLKCGIKNFIVGSKGPAKDISKKALLEKTGVVSSIKSCYNFVEDHHINRSTNRKVDSLFRVDYGVYAKALLSFLEIRITHSRHCESIVLLQRVGMEKGKKLRGKNEDIKELYLV
ncbi:hypothetical protein C0033_07165 [Clostridium sp. chh4-2]|nr:hypothetical protein C0033_07165 [Clostridium sp. chh4-2]